jgi:hypothetical protein
MSCISRSDFDHGWGRIIVKSRNNYEMISIKVIAYWIIEDSVNLSDGIWDLSISPLLGFHHKWMVKTSSHISFGDVPCRSNEVPQSNTFHHHPREQLISLLWNHSDEVIHLFSHSLKQASIVWWSRSTFTGERKSFGANNQQDFWHFWVHWTVILQKVFYERREKDCQMSDGLYCVRRKHVKNFLRESLVSLDQSWDIHAYILIYVYRHTANILYLKIMKEVSLSDSVLFASLQNQYDPFRLLMLIVHQTHRKQFVELVANRHVQQLN